jgi:putative CocE/NonD family hydrolase
MHRVGGVATLVVLVALAGCLGVAPDDEAEPNTVDEPAATGEPFTDTHVFEGNYTADEPYSLTLEEGPHDVLEQRVLELESPADGAAIEVGVVLPDAAEDGEVPVVTFASPYLYPLKAQDLEQTRPRLTDNFVEHGYAVAFVAVRGTADSGGCSDLMGPRERADLDHAVTWLGTQDWSNGNVGMLGVSYDGSTPWEVAAEGNEHLETIVPISGVNDVHHLMYYNGTPEQRGAVLLNALYYGWFAFSLPDRAPARTADAVVCPQAYEGFVASVESSVTGERDRLGYWAERTSRPGVEENYNGSVFLVQGLQDWNVDPHHNVPWARELDTQHDLTVKYWLGQWGHAWPDGDYLDQPTRRLDFAETLLRWFDHELKGEEVDVGPKVQVQDHTGQWRSADAWPPEDANEATLYLAPDGELARADDAPEATVTVGPAEPSGSDTCATSVQLACTSAADAPCGACATFTSEASDERTHVAGSPTLHVDVTPQGATGHLTAVLFVVEDGERERIGWTQMDLRFHEGDREAEQVTPGERITARMQLQPMDAVVPEDARLELVLEQSTRGDQTPTKPPAPVDVHVGGDASPLAMQTFAPEDAAFFASPGE